MELTVSGKHLLPVQCEKHSMNIISRVLSVSFGQQGSFPTPLPLGGEGFHTPDFIFLRATSSTDVLLLVSSRAVNVSEVRPTHCQKLWTEATHSKFGHIGEWLANSAAKEEGTNFFIQCSHITVGVYGLWTLGQVTYTAGFTYGNLQEKKQLTAITYKTYQLQGSF